jgi:hypothetical protein
MCRASAVRAIPPTKHPSVPCRAGLPGRQRDQPASKHQNGQHPWPVDRLPPSSIRRDGRGVEVPDDQDRLDAADFEQRRKRKQQRDHDSGRQTLGSCAPRDRRRQIQREEVRHVVDADGRDHSRDDQPEEAADEGERDRLRQIRADHAPVPAAEALQGGDGLQPLLNEHARDAGDADSAEHQNAKADEAQEPIRVGHAAGHAVFHDPERRERIEPRGFERLRELLDEGAVPSVGRVEQPAVCDAAPEPGQAGRDHVAVVDGYARRGVEAKRPVSGEQRQGRPIEGCADVGRAGPGSATQARLRAPGSWLRL